MHQPRTRTARRRCVAPGIASIQSNRYVTLAEIEGALVRLRRLRMPAGVELAAQNLNDLRISGLAQLYAFLVRRRLPGLYLRELNRATQQALEAGSITEDAA